MIIENKTQKQDQFQLALAFIVNHSYNRQGCIIVAVFCFSLYFNKNKIFPLKTIYKVKVVAHDEHEIVDIKVTLQYNQK